MIDDPADWGYYRPASEFCGDMGDEEIAEWREELRGNEAGGWLTPFEWKALRLMKRRLRIWDATGVDSSGMTEGRRRYRERLIEQGRLQHVRDLAAREDEERERVRSAALRRHHAKHSASIPKAGR